ncbi:MAG: hypothetical protein IKY67_11170 [Paludibacteraceae bacterium]|nr:hypothetical protein [Paludibacteraceae bacterium]
MKAKIIGIISLIIILAVAGVIYFQYFFVFGEGVKAGELNYMVHKGYIFKTYEGKLIQSGFKGQSANGVATGIQSYEFQFSVTDKAVADSLMRCSGKQVELHYKEYINPLIWRGVSEFVVDSIIAVK